MEPEKKSWTPLHTMVTSYTISWGFASMDRLLIAMLFPFIIPYFHMNFAQAGLIMTCMSVVYLVMASLGGALSDRFGRKKVIMPSVLIFSLCSFITGLAGNFAALVGIRSLVGGAEGAFYVSGGAQISEEAPAEKRGLFLGLYNSAFALFGSFIAPIYATQIASRWGWKMACYLTIVPGIILALIIARKVKESSRFLEAKKANKPKGSWTAAVKERNVILSLLIAMTWLLWLWSWLTFGIVFFNKVKGLSSASAGLVMSALGLGGFFGMIIVSRLSDSWGRKPVLAMGTIVGIIGSLLILLVPHLSFGLIYLVLFLTFFGAWGICPLFLQTIACDVVPPEHVAVALGFIISIGELFGIAIAPPILGLVGDKFGLPAAMLTGVASLIPCLLLGFALKESAPKFTKAKMAQQAELA